MAIERYFVVGILLLAVAVGACSSAGEISADTTPQPEDGSAEPAMEPSADSIAMADETGDGTEPGDVTEPESSDALCLAIDEQFDSVLAGDPDFSSEVILERLPEDLRSELEALEAEELEAFEAGESEGGWSEYYGGAKRSEVAEKIDAHTLDECGVPYLRLSMHLVMACSPVIDHVDYNCEDDPRDDLDSIKTLEQIERDYYEWLESWLESSFGPDDGEDVKFSEIGSSIS